MPWTGRSNPITNQLSCRVWVRAKWCLEKGFALFSNQKTKVLLLKCFFFLIFNMRSFCCCVNICFGRELQRKKYKTGRCGVVDWKYFYQFWSFFCSIWKYWPKKRMNWSKNKRNRNRKTIGWAGGVVERWKGIFFFFYTEIAFLETVTLKGYFIGFLLLSRKHFPQTGVITNTKQRKRNEREGADGEWVGVGVGPPQQHLFNWRPPRLARAVVFRLTAAPR